MQVTNEALDCRGNRILPFDRVEVANHPEDAGIVIYVGRQDGRTFVTVQMDSGEEWTKLDAEWDGPR